MNERVNVDHICPVQITNLLGGFVFMIYKYIHSNGNHKILIQVVVADHRLTY